MNEIVYHFDQNHEFLDSMAAKNNEITSLRGDIMSAFNLLNEALTGEFQVALNQKAAQVDLLMEDLGDNIANTHSKAQNQQEAMQLLDRQQAQGL